MLIKIDSAQSRSREPRQFCALAAALAATLLLAGCGGDNGGPIVISAIGDPPALRNPNLEPLNPPSALLAETTAQGLVRFDSSGHIVPALAQRWIVSDDGLRYTFRLARTEWAGGGKVTAAQVVARLKAATGAASRNRLKPLLGTIEEVVAMTDDVLEIRLKSPRPNFLQLLAQPEMAIIRNGKGSGPYQASAGRDGALALSIPESPSDDDNDGPDRQVHLRGEPAAFAVARFKDGDADFVTGGTAGDLLVARAARLPAQLLRFDPVAGLFGLVFLNRDKALADKDVREALGMAIDRAALVAEIGVPGLQPRDTMLSIGTNEVPQPAAPAWAARPLAERRAQAARTIAAAAGSRPITLRVAIPAGPGHRVIFAHLRNDWRRIGVSAIAVRLEARADLQLVDRVAPVTMASWYLRNFTCAASIICSPEADQAMEAARIAPTRQGRRESLIQADILLRDITPFIALTAPVRWSLVSPRLTGFQPNVFGRHAAGELIAPRR